MRVSAGEPDDSGKLSHMRPGYFEPFERVYRSSMEAEPRSSEDIREFVVKAITQIDAAAHEDVNASVVSKLVDFCLQLNREFVRRPLVENRVGRRQRSVQVEAFVR